MSKIPIDCLRCGGTHEDNPSGRLRHARTAKHKAAMAETFTNIDPAKPILIPGGQPWSAEEKEAHREISQIGLAIAQRTIDRDKAQHDLDYRNKPKHLHQYGDRSRRNLQIRIDDANEAIKLWEYEKAKLVETRDALALEREKADAEMYAAVELYVTTLFSGDSTIWIRRNGSNNFVVHGVTGKIRELEQMGQKFELPETVFGHEATVYGPDLGWWTSDEERPIKPAYVSWGSKQMDTIAEAERLIGIYLTATSVARLLNELAGIES